MNKSILLLNPAYYTKKRLSPNIGDLIISRAIERELHNIFGKNCNIIHMPTHSYLSISDIKILKKVDYIVVGGSNLLWFRFFPRASFRIGLLGLLYYRNLILLGVGWGGYEFQKIGVWSKYISKLIFSKSNIHSMRDEFTIELCKNKLQFKNCINTACPTLWFLANRKDFEYKTTKGDRCVFSLTDYNKDVISDKKLISELSSKYNYTDLYFWPQGAGDLDYARSLGYTGKVINRDLESLIDFYKENISTDYIGTRLHAGILALEFGIRTLIIQIDNRALEISRDIGLPILSRSNLSELQNWINNSPEISINIPLENIQKWRSQFFEV